MPNSTVISGFRGVVDFYVYCGRNCARMWPQSPGHRRSAAVMAQWSHFSDAVHLWNKLPEEVRQQYRFMASGTPLSGRDLFIRSYIKGLYRYEPPS